MNVCDLLLCFHRGNQKQDKAAFDMSPFMCICRLYICVCICVHVCTCVWSPCNDYYGSTPISRIVTASHYISDFSILVVTERKTYSPHLLLRPHLLVSHTKNTHMLTHPHPVTHPPANTHTHTHTHTHRGNTWRTSIWVYMVFYTLEDCRLRLVYMRTTNLNKDHRHIHKHTHGLLRVTTETNRWSGLAVFRDNQSWWQAAPSTLRDIWMGGVGGEIWGISRGGRIPHDLLIITVTSDLWEEGHSVKAATWHWSQWINGS